MKKTLPICILAVTALSAQEVTRTPSVPSAKLLRADPLVLTGKVDSNSPVVWDIVDGTPQVVVMTSVAGRPSRAVGASLVHLGPATPVVVEPWPGGGVWMESVLKDEGDVWYGFYHNEMPPLACAGAKGKTYPRIGVARSLDFGATWQDLGIVLEPSPEAFECETQNAYFVGGYGDASVLVDPGTRDVFIYFSQYGREPSQQGIAVARLAWADRDDPVGKVMVWSGGTWLAPRLVAGESDGELDARERWDIPSASAIFRTRLAWHDGDTRVDAYWGPSLHFNVYLQQYVMLLNRARDEEFGQEGIYISFSPKLDDPTAWSVPTKLLDGGSWYPQVIGVTPGGTDKIAGQLARFFMGGRSEYVIQFQR